MKQFTVKPLYDSDWHGINDATVGDKMETIHCTAGPGIILPPVKAGKTYRYLGEFPAMLETTETGMPIFSVREVEEIEEVKSSH